MTSKNYTKDWARLVLERWLTDGYELDELAIRKRKFDAIVVPNTLNYMEAEWLASAARNIGIDELGAICFEYGHRENPDVSALPAARDAIIYHEFENSYRYMVVTGPQEEFIYYKDEANLYSIICGGPSFLSKAYKCSFDTAKLMYFDWVEDYTSNEAKRKFLTRIWNRYSESQGK